MKVLLHICCAPCACYPVKVLQAEEFELFGYFFNPNIHPYAEFKKRRDTVQVLADKMQLRVIYQEDYDVAEFFRNVAFREEQRCLFCYQRRLEASARLAKRGKFDYWTTTLLYSKQQKHDLIIQLAEESAKKIGVKFLYRDFREGWKEGIEKSHELGLYRQQYCGCLLSERERYLPRSKHVDKTDSPDDSPFEEPQPLVGP
ncbi:MAG: epoxyqueuosine reductase QueH [Deltaproteobacteria bacterium]|nr:epoxyqueuosine reductase QueH [Deltaproteobacteria bacterium]